MCTMCALGVCCLCFLLLSKLISYFDNHLFPHYLHKFPVFPRFVAVFLFFLRFERLSYFPRLASVVFFSLAWLWLSSFPALCYVVLVFPALGSGCVVFLRLARVSCFPALVSEWAVFFALGSGRAFFPPRLVSVFFALDSYDSKYFLALYSLLGFPHRLIVFIIRFSDATNDLKHNSS